MKKKFHCKKKNGYNKQINVKVFNFDTKFNDYNNYQI